MKTFVFLLCSFICLNVNPLFGQTFRSTSTKQEMHDFHKAAKQASKEIALLLPAVMNVRSAAARQYVSILKRAKILANNVNRVGNRMTPRQYRSFQTQLARLTLELEKVGKTSSFKLTTGGSNGGPAPGTKGECFKSCDDAYGKGCGQGKCWNKFWCKAGCIVF